MKYFGIADAHGIESFVKGDINDKEHAQVAMVMQLRASLNRQRHAIVYIVDIPESTVKDIDKLLSSGDYIEALVTLKMSVKALSLSDLPGAEKSWKMIPNPDLDPWH